MNINPDIIDKAICRTKTCIFRLYPEFIFFLQIFLNLIGAAIIISVEIYKMNVLKDFWLKRDIQMS